MPDPASEELLARELIGLPTVIIAIAAAPAKPRTYDLQMAPAAGSDAVASDIVGPLNAKLGAACFRLGATAGARVTIALDARCADGLARERLETNPPGGLYGAPPARQKAVIKNPETLRKLVV